MFVKIVVIWSLLVTAQVQGGDKVLGNGVQLKNQQQAFITVGAGGNCNYNEVQTAIDSGDSDVIRIARDKTYFENVIIDNKSIELLGGYANCTDASNDISDSQQTIISGFGDGFIVKIETSSNENHDVILRHLFMGNGNKGVRILAHDSSIMNVTLDHVRSYNNTNNGVHIESATGTQAHVIINDSQMDFNKGSGVRCEGSGGSLILTGQTVIDNNQFSGGTGGGAWVVACDLTIYSPTLIRDNEAKYGGAIAASQGSIVTLFGGSEGCENGICFGDWSSPVEISGNDAEKFGGGFYIGSNAGVLMANVLIKNNQAIDNGLGGALYVVDSGVVLAAGGGSQSEEDCWSPGACLQFVGNKASQRGGVVYSSTNATVDITGALITSNRADEGIISYSSEGGEVNITNSVIANNGQNGDGYSDTYLFSNKNGGQLVLHYVTVAENHSTSSLISNLSDGEVNVHSSIILDQFQPVFSGEVLQSYFGCVIAHENLSFNADESVSTVNYNLDQIFVNPIQGDYHLVGGSPAIDYCYDIPNYSINEDLDGDLRGIDNPSMIDLHGVYDIGADESDAFWEDDLIFEDGFE